MNTPNPRQSPTGATWLDIAVGFVLLAFIAVGFMLASAWLGWRW